MKDNYKERGGEREEREYVEHCNIVPEEKPLCTHHHHHHKSDVASLRGETKSIEREREGEREKERGGGIKKAALPPIKQAIISCV